MTRQGNISDELRSTQRGGQSLSDTAKPSSGRRPKPCEGCEVFDDLQRRVTELEMNAEAIRLDIAEMSGRVISAVDSIPVIIKTAMSVHVASSKGRNVEDSSAPGAGQAVVKTPIGQIRGSQRWLAGLMIALAVIAAVAFVANGWGPPARQQQTSGAPPR